MPLCDDSLSKEDDYFLRGSRSKNLGEHDTHSTPGGQEPGLQSPVEKQDQQHFGSLLHNFLVRVPESNFEKTIKLRYYFFEASRC